MIKNPHIVVMTYMGILNDVYEDSFLLLSSVLLGASCLAD